LHPAHRPAVLGRDDQKSDRAIDQITMSEDQLLRGMEMLTPMEPSSAIERRR
jgi:hypothetical protein